MFPPSCVPERQIFANAKRTCREVEGVSVSSMREAYDIQAGITDIATQFVRGMMNRVLLHNGWRVGATSPKAREEMGLTQPYRAPLYSGYEKKWAPPPRRAPSAPITPPREAA